MSKEFRHLKFGVVPVTMDSSALEGSTQILKSFLSSYDGFNLIDDTESHKEVFAVTRRYVGTDFRNWLIVNFRNGNGARRELCRKIAGWVAGKYVGRVVVDQIKMDLSKLNYLKPTDTQIKTAILYDDYSESCNKWVVDAVDFSVIEDRHFYDFMALIGPELAAKFTLSLDGIYGR